MTVPTKKLNNGFTMPVYGLGTWQMGGRFERTNARDPDNNDPADIAGIRAAIDHGVIHIDTAESYAEGHAEELVAEGIKDYDRSKLFLVSKVNALHMAPNDVIAACKASLKRLQTGYLDLYLLHRHELSVPLAETMAAMDELLAEGLIRNIGVSNFLPEFLDEAQSYTKNKIVCNQVHYNLEFREPEASGLLEYCQKNDVFLAAWRPMGKGALAVNPPLVVQELCKKYNKTPAQIAINWLVSQDHVITLAKTRRVEHLEENLGALGWQMEAEDIERLRRDYPNQKQISDIVPLA